MKYHGLDFLVDAIKDKNVAIVGNAKSLFDYKDGSEIDKADFVIRFNKGFITKPESQGTRTDLLILAIEMSNELIDSFHAKYVVNRCSMRVNKERAMGFFEKRIKLAFKQLFGAKPSSGYIAIAFCLFAEAKSITLFGFDWERTPTFYNPKEYKSPHAYSKEEKAVRNFVESGRVKIYREPK